MRFMPDQADPDASPWRRYLRFSICQMIVLVLLTGVCLGWVVRAVRTCTHLQREAVADIGESGGFRVVGSGAGEFDVTLPLAKLDDGFDRLWLHHFWFYVGLFATGIAVILLLAFVTDAQTQESRRRS